MNILVLNGQSTSKRQYSGYGESICGWGRDKRTSGYGDFGLPEENCRMSCMRILPHKRKQNLYSAGRYARSLSPA